MSHEQALALTLAWLVVCFFVLIAALNIAISALLVKPPKYIYGAIRTAPGKEVYARKDLNTGKICVRLWKAGQQGHNTDFWTPAGPGWEESFISEEQEVS